MSLERILCEGYLEKKEKKWEAFWVRLIESRIYFYQEKYVPVQQYHGFLELSGSTQCSTHKSRKSKYQFKIKTEKGVFLFQTITEDERTSWMANILQARDRRVRSISSVNLSTFKHSDATSKSPRRPSSATGIPSSRSTEKVQMKRPCSAENPSKNRTNNSDKFSSSFTKRSRSASCNDVPSTHPPPIHMETHPTLRRKQENYESKPPSDRTKRSRFFSLPGFRHISKRFSRSQDNLGEVNLLRNEQHLHATHSKRGGSLNLDIVSPESQTFHSDTLKLDRSKDFKQTKSRKHKFEFNSFDTTTQGLPPRSASVCSAQSNVSESAHSTLSLDRKTRKKMSKEQKKNPERDMGLRNANTTTDKDTVNKLSGIRCQLNNPKPTNQQLPPNPPTTEQYYKSPINNKQVNTHSNPVAKKPPTPSRHTIEYEKSADQSDSRVSPVKPPVHSKRHHATHEPSERHRTKESEEKRFGHNLGRDERSALLSRHRAGDWNGNHTEKFEDSRNSKNGTNLQNRSGQRMNPFYENETALYCRFSWFHGDLNREDAENLLRFCGKVGSFLIRNSKKHSKHLCLSLRYSDRIRHFKIDRSENGYSIDGLEGHYTNLNKLVEVFISWNDNMVKPLEKVIAKQTTDLTPETPPLGSEALIYEDMTDDII